MNPICQEIDPDEPHLTPNFRTGTPSNVALVAAGSLWPTYATDGIHSDPLLSTDGIHSGPLFSTVRIHSGPLMSTVRIHSGPLISTDGIYSGPSISTVGIYSGPLSQRSGLNWDSPLFTEEGELLLRVPSREGGERSCL
jgi:hypothetical protein